MLQIRPILTALHRHKAGTVLIALQIALTLAIICNAFSIIQQRLSHLSQPTGVDEANLIVVNNEWVQPMGTQQVEAQVNADLAALRQIPGVREATISNAYPLRGNGWDDYIMLKPDQVKKTTSTALFFSDEHFIDTVGTRLIAGRNFRPDEIAGMDVRDKLDPPSAIVTKALADRLFPGGSALGKTFYLDGSNPTVIVGIVDVLQPHSVDRWAAAFASQTTLLPRRLLSDWGNYYLVRAQPGQSDAVIGKLAKTLMAQNPMRIINGDYGIKKFSQIRQEAYDRDRGMAVLMGIVCVVLLSITAAGIVGLTSFWVGQRRKQIGVRRALGATRGDILNYFLTENLLISGGGALLGILLALGLNLWLVTRFEMQRLPTMYVLSGVIVLLLLGQAAVLAPAMRASKVSPVEATRSV
ncbi:MAG TPA: FtsX-like permease family protein [Dyella sp.]|uniref:ABC transporter permease n=1 Tax=Dyella sp. TaxID=1869338 RepID=UPI002F9326B2